MPGNSQFRFRNASVLAVASIDAPVEVSSAELDEQLTDTYRRVGLRPGLIERLAGIRTRRWWADGTTFADGAALAGGKAIAESGVSSGTSACWSTPRSAGRTWSRPPPRRCTT